MRLRRKHAKGPDPAGAAAEAIISRKDAERELARQQQAAHAEHSEVIAPLRRLREKNHLSEMFLRTITEGYKR